MQLLAIETCFGKFSIALFKNRELIAYFASTEQTKQAEELIPAIEKLLAEHQVAYKDLSAIAVCIGPGSFTGLRIGLAAAKGFALALGCELIGVSSLEAAIYKKGGKEVFLDASRGEAYYQKDLHSEPKLIPHAGDFDEPATAAEVGYVALNKPANHQHVSPLYIRKPDAKIPKAAIMAAIHAECYEKPWKQNIFEGLDSIIKDEVGFVAYKTILDECEIKMICVLPAARKQGIAENLMRELLKVTNVKKIFLEVEDTNHAARGLYKKLDFSEYGTRRDYYGKGRHAVLMSLDK